MTNHTEFTSRISSLNRFIIAATVLSLPFLAFYWMALAALIPDGVVGGNAGWLTPLSMMLYLPFMLAAYTVFGNIYLYAGMSVAGVTTAVIGLWRGDFSKPTRAWLLLLICAIVAFPFVYRYQPALTAISGYKMALVTETSLLGGIVKASQNVTEQTPCTYELLGWSADNQLFYQATCDGNTQLWQYTLDASPSRLQITALPADLHADTIDDLAVLPMVRADGVRPEKYESTTRPIYLKSDGFVSSDGVWTAVVTQHLYGTQDVIILTKINYAE